jgi:hypothetical protein
MRFTRGGYAEATRSALRILCDLCVKKVFKIGHPVLH